MSITEIKTIKYKCDACQKEIPDIEVFRRFEFTLWSDRDVAARVTASLDLSISYHPTGTDICRACAKSAFQRVVKEMEQNT